MNTMLKALGLSFIISFFGPIASYAGWIDDGVPLTRKLSRAGAAVVASDGSASAYIAFPVTRDGANHIIVQHVGSQGELLWSADGVAIRAAAGCEQDLQIISDGAGGAIITWQDSRSGNSDVYAQRINASGTVVWPADGVAICTTAENQGFLQIISDGAGGAIITWETSRVGDKDIYAQRVNASGTTLWSPNGVPICTATGYQQYPQLFSDGAGGAIITWQDSRSGDYRIYCQHVNSLGSVLWAVNGIAICPAAGSQQYPNIASDGAGGAIIAWLDFRSGNSDIYAQKVTSSGAILWAADGVALTVATGYQRPCKIIADGAGGAIAVWDDLRAGNYDIYAQRVNISGDIQWAMDGVAICTAGDNQQSPHIAFDGAGRAIITWSDYRSGDYDIYAQLVEASGEVQWMDNGMPICIEAGYQWGSQIIADAFGGGIITWRDDRPFKPGIYTQRVNTTGNILWLDDGVALCALTGEQVSAQIASDGIDGAIIIWTDSRSDEGDIYLQRLNGTGDSQWTGDGVGICTAAGEQSCAIIVSDGANGAIAAWHDLRSGNYDIYAQRVDASGVVQWAGNGAAICAAKNNKSSAKLISDGVGGAIVAWIDERSGNRDIYAQRANASGEVLWAADGVLLCTATGYGSFDIISDGSEGAIVAWADDSRSGNYDIYAQRVTASGDVQWAVNGIALCTAPGSQQYLRIISDASNGAIVAWQDSRNGSSDIYAQRVNSSGAVQWAADGVVICAATNAQEYPHIASDYSGGAIITWGDQRSGNSDIYAQRVNASGSVLWTANGVSLCSSAGSQRFPQIVSDGPNDAIIMWMDDRSSKWAVYAQKLSSSGEALWLIDGVMLSSDTGWLEMASIQIISDGAEGAIVAWEDHRYGSWIYAQRVINSGEIVSTMLQEYSVALDERYVRIEWILSEFDESASFEIYRGESPSWDYSKLANAEIKRDALSFSLIDRGCSAGSKYKYRIDYKLEGKSGMILFETETIEIPAFALTLYQNHPNPFNPNTTIRFYIPQAQNILLEVYDVAGKQVAKLSEGLSEQGFHEVIWDGRNGAGLICSSGIYFSRLKAGKQTLSSKMVLLR